MFQIDVRNLVKNKLQICKEYHIQPSEIDRMQFFEYEYMIEDIKEFQKQEEKARKEQEKQQNSSMPNFNSMMSNMKSSMPQMNIPKF